MSVLVFHPSPGSGEMTLLSRQPTSPSLPTTLWVCFACVVIRHQQLRVSKPTVLSFPQAASVDRGLGGR